MTNKDPNPPRGPIHRATKALGLLNVTILSVLALGVIGISLNETVLRVLYPRGLPDWGAEVTTYMMAWGLMLSLPILVLRGQNIAADFLVNAIPQKMRRAIGLGEDIAGAVFCAVCDSAEDASCHRAWRGYRRGCLLRRGCMGRLSGDGLGASAGADFGHLAPVSDVALHTRRARGIWFVLGFLPVASGSTCLANSQFLES